MTYGQRRYIRYSESSKWGELYGLLPSDLTNEQLKKLSFKKLVEFAATDKRAEKLVAESLMTEDMNNLRYLENLEDKELQGLPLFLDKYNEFVVKRSKAIDGKTSSWSDDRTRWVRWELLNDKNRKREINRRLNGSRSVAILANIDYQWLRKSDVELANKTILHVMDKGSTKETLQMLSTINHSELYREHPLVGAQLVTKSFKNSGKVLESIISKMPKEVYLAILPKLFEQPKGAYMYAVCNPHTPKKQALKALRAIAKKRSIPNIKIPIDVGMLKDLPPVTRLDILESIMRNVSKTEDLPFTDLTEEKLRHMLFTAVIRHTNRVEFVVNTFNKYKK